MSAVLRSSSRLSKILFIRSVHSLSRRFSFWFEEMNFSSYGHINSQSSSPRNVSCLSRLQRCVSESQSGLGVNCMGNPVKQSRQGGSCSRLTLPCGRTVRRVASESSAPARTAKAGWASPRPLPPPRSSSWSWSWWSWTERDHISRTTNDTLDTSRQGRLTLATSSRVAASWRTNHLP